MSSLSLKKNQRFLVSLLQLQLQPCTTISYERFFSVVSSPDTAAAAALPDNQSLNLDEVAKINLLIPRLCLIDQLPTAVRLTSAALLLPRPPPLKSLSLPILIHSLASQPDAALPMSLLTRLTRTPPHLTPIATMLIASYLKNRKTREAVEMFDWMTRPGSPCLPDPASYGILLGACCRNGLAFEALKVLAAMLSANLVPGSKLRMSLFGSLLREARIKEAKELNEALSSCVSSDGVKVVHQLLDRIFRDWTD